MIDAEEQLRIDYLLGKLKDKDLIRKFRWEDKHNTAHDMTPQQAAKVRELGDKIADLPYEKAYIINEEGEIVLETNTRYPDRCSNQGCETDEDLTRCVHLHNHPCHEYGETDLQVSCFKASIKGRSRLIVYPLDYGIAGRIGVSFSCSDIISAAESNYKAIVVRTPTYEYYLHRGYYGWGRSRRKIRQLYEERFNSVFDLYYPSDYVSKDIIDKRTKTSRVLSIAVHKAVKRIAAEYGMIYTRIKRSERSEHDSRMAALSEEKHKELRRRFWKGLSQSERRKWRTAVKNSKGFLVWFDKYSADYDLSEYGIIGV